MAYLAVDPWYAPRICSSSSADGGPPRPRPSTAPVLGAGGLGRPSAAAEPGPAEPGPAEPGPGPSVAPQLVREPRDVAELTALDVLAEGGRVDADADVDDHDAAPSSCLGVTEPLPGEDSISSGIASNVPRTSAPGLAPNLRRASTPRIASELGPDWVQVGNVTYFVGEVLAPQDKHPNWFRGMERDAWGRWATEGTLDLASSLSRVRSEQPTKRRKTAETDLDHELDFLLFLEEHLRGSSVPMSIHSIRKDLLPEWMRERPWMSGEKASQVWLSQAFVEEHSFDLVWIPGPGGDGLNRADFVGWDPDNSALAQLIAAESEAGAEAEAAVTRGRRLLGEVDSFSMRMGHGFITCNQDHPGVGRQVLFYQGALPGIFATCQLGGHHAVRKTTWFKGRKVSFAVDFSAGKPQAKDIRFIRKA